MNHLLFSSTCRIALWAIPALLLAIPATPASAAVFVFNTDPFAGSTALTTPGRQVVGNELFISTFDVNTDQFEFDPAVFNFSTLNFFNGTASSLPTGGVNVIVLQDVDNDNNPATAFNAGTAANLIANSLTTDGAGFFVYFNSGLSLNRLVYSTNLNASDADLKILARIVSPTGAAGIAALPTFGANNFTATPEPSAGLLVLSAAGCMALARRRKHSSQ
jgi:hypothetical protein